MNHALLGLLAHIGVDPVHNLMHGLQHPLTGLDHMGAMIAVGIWAAQRGGRAVWLVPLSFVSVMTIGAGLGMVGIQLPFVEPGILLSLMVLGLLVALAVRLPLWASVAIVSVFALAHGHAHGAEAPAVASGLKYVLGFVITTGLLHATGVAFGLTMQQLRTSQVARFAGAAIALCGVYLCIF
jgi:urease accessory protein